MAYATEADFIALIGAAETAALADPENTGEPVAGRIAAGLSAASADILAILGKRTATVATDNPDFLRTACIHIARWQLSGAGAIENDPIKARHDHYVKLLQDMADGEVGNSGQGGGSGGQVVMVSSGRVFSRPARRF